MAISEFSKEYHEKMFPGYQSKFLETDPEFIERFNNFAFDEVINQDNLDDRTRFIAIMATLIGCQGIDEFKAMIPAALNFGVTPVELKEIVYQAVAYLGIGRVFPFLKGVNEKLEEKGIKLPLEGQATTTMENRLEAGAQAQVDIFGESMKNFYKSGPEESKHINKWLADNCFGDYYTRKGLDYKEREMITFCFLSAQGGCEPQLTSHASANMKIGNDKNFLIKIISGCLPYIGYPRSLNALRCVNEAEKDNLKEEFKVEHKENHGGMFGIGNPNTAFAQYFKGNSYLNPLTKQGESAVFLANVTFEPACRNNWHIHHASNGGGQILICIEGEGWYQEEGKEAQSLKSGDVVVIPANVKHWHGAKKDSWFSHIAVEVPGENTKTQWCEEVSDEEYHKL